MAELIKVKRSVYSGVSAEVCNADGYRLIYMVMKQAPLVVLLDIYPKRGPSQQLDIEDNETNRLIQEFVAELNAGQLAIHDINDDLRIIS